MKGKSAAESRMKEKLHGVNVKLREGDYQRLLAVAERMGFTCAGTLARKFIVDALASTQPT